MTNAWLQQQRKGALTEIADHVGLKKCAPTLPIPPSLPNLSHSKAYHYVPQQRRALQKDRPRSRIRRAPSRKQLQAIIRLKSRSLLRHRRPFVAHEAGSRDRHRADGREGEEAKGQEANP